MFCARHFEYSYSDLHALLAKHVCDNSKSGTGTHISISGSTTTTTSATTTSRSNLTHTQVATCSRQCLQPTSMLNS